MHEGENCIFVAPWASVFSAHCNHWGTLNFAYVWVLPPKYSDVMFRGVAWALGLFTSEADSSDVKPRPGDAGFDGWSVFTLSQPRSS